MPRRAVVIGSNGPAVGSATPLKYAVSDARRLAEVLRGPLCGFEVKLIEGATAAGPVRDCIDRISDECGHDDTLVVTFAGHGIVDRGMLLMLDQSRVVRPLITMLHADDIVKAMRFSRARYKLLILDCCHAGSMLLGNSFRDAGGEKMTNLIPGIDSSAESDATTFVALLASDKFEKARELDDLGGGFLTQAVCDALGPEFQHADRGDDGAIDLEDLKSWLEERADNYNRHHQETKVPTPYFYGRTRGQFYITMPWMQHQVDEANGTELLVLPAYTKDRVWCIGRTPVTNAQYRNFLRAADRLRPPRPPQGEVYYRKGGTRSKWVDVVPDTSFEGWVGPFEPWDHEEFSASNQPVVCVSYKEAVAYAEWLTSKSWRQLQFEVTPLDLWDIAAFGKNSPVHDRREWRQREIYDKAAAPAPVSDAGNRTTPFGAVDMLGNVWEWCSGEHSYSSGLISSRIPIATRALEIRGGGYLDDLSCIRPFLNVSSMPERENCRHSDIGFRVAATVAVANLPPEIAERVFRGGFNLTR
jgi:hypothetical protein